MNAQCKARTQLTHLGVALLVLNPVYGCSHAQKPEPVVVPTKVITACNAELAAQVKAALRAAPGVNDMHIDTHCENGNVVLTGLVEDERALLDVMRVAKKTANGLPIVDAVSIMKTSPH